MEAGFMLGHVLQVRKTEQRGGILAGCANLVRSVRVAANTVGAGESSKSDGRGRVEGRARVRKIPSNRVLGSRAGRVGMAGSKGARSRPERSTIAGRVWGGRHLSCSEAFAEVDDGLSCKSAGRGGHGCGLLGSIRLVDSLRGCKEGGLRGVGREHSNVERLSSATSDVRGRRHLPVQLFLTVRERQQCVVLLRLEYRVLGVRGKLGVTGSLWGAEREPRQGRQGAR